MIYANLEQLDKLQALAEEVRKLAVERPDYVYDPPGIDEEKPRGGPCLYVHDRGTPGERPGCIIGHALTRLGYSIPEKLEGQTALRAGAELILDLDALQSGIYEIGGDARIILNALDDVQGEQDEGKPWGVAAQKLAPVLVTA